MAEILIVEDYPMMATLLARMLRKQGHAVARALSVGDALKLADRVFDHAVLDIDLPDGNGVDLAAQLLSRHCVESMLFFTATRDQETLLRAAELGAVIDKSSGVEALVQAIEQLDQNKRRAHEPAPVSGVVEIVANAGFVNVTTAQLELFAV